MGIVQDSLEVVKLAAKFANPELIERVTALNEQVLELSAKNVELQKGEETCPFRPFHCPLSVRFNIPSVPIYRSTQPAWRGLRGEWRFVPP